MTWGVCPSQSGKYTVPKRVAFVSDLGSEVAVGRKRREPGKRDSRPRHVIHGPEPRVPRKPLVALALRFGGFGTFPFGIECDTHHSLSDRCSRHHHNTTATYQVCLAHLCPECRLAQCRFCPADGAHARPRQAIRFYGYGTRRTATRALFVAVVKFFSPTRTRAGTVARCPHCKSDAPTAAARVREISSTQGAAPLLAHG